MKRFLPLLFLLTAFAPIEEEGNQIYYAYLPILDAQNNVGIAANVAPCDEYAILNAAVRHSWADRAYCPEYVVWVPMMRAIRYNQHRTGLEQYAFTVPVAYDGFCQFLNEPDKAGQDNISPDEAAVLYHIWRTYYAPNCKVIAGGVSHHGYEWIGQWREAYHRRYFRYPDMAGYAIHSYSTHPRIHRNRVVWFRNQIDKWGEGDKLLWVTEWGGSDMTPEQLRETKIMYDGLLGPDEYHFYFMLYQLRRRTRHPDLFYGVEGGNGFNDPPRPLTPHGVAFVGAWGLFGARAGGLGVELD